MGNSASSSAEHPSNYLKTCAREGGENQEYTQLERKLQSDLTYLKRSFSHLKIPKDGNQQSIPLSSLEGVFNLGPIKVENIHSADEHSYLPMFISEIGPAIIRTFFTSTSGQVDWPHFLSGFNMCCKEGLGAVKLKMLFAVFVKGKQEHDLLPKLQVDRDQDLTGFVTMSRLRDVLSLFWLLMCHSRLQNVQDKEVHVTLPNFHPLLASCYATVSEAPDANWKGNEEIPVEKLISWVLATIPGITDCFSEYVKAQLQRLGLEQKTIESENNPSLPAREVEHKAGKALSHAQIGEAVEPGLLTLETAWAVGLSQRDSSCSDLVTAACDLCDSASNSRPTLLYRSSGHGRGLSRFWTRVEGYKASVLMLISGTSIVGDNDQPSGEKWEVGALVPGGFDNKEVFYGSSGCCLFAISPLFLPLRSTGKETNYVYSHKRSPGVVYGSQPKPEGVGFGGSHGKNRLWLDDEFLTVTIQHHAMDKSYHSGALVPGQGYLAVKGRVSEVEVWGLGGYSAEEQQAIYQHRENLFSEQRRKVDLKNFGNWKDSPDAAMMDLMSDPNKAAREER